MRSERCSCSRRLRVSHSLNRSSSSTSKNMVTASAVIEWSLSFDPNRITSTTLLASTNWCILSKLLNILSNCRSVIVIRLLNIIFSNLGRYPDISSSVWSVCVYSCRFRVFMYLPALSRISFVSWTFGTPLMLRILWERHANLAMELHLSETFSTVKRSVVFKYL